MKNTVERNTEYLQVSTVDIETDEPPKVEFLVIKL